VHFTQNPSSSLYESRISRCAGPLWLWVQWITPSFILSDSQKSWQLEIQDRLWYWKRFLYCRNEINQKWQNDLGQIIHRLNFPR
jgi:hypothetical protein